MRSHNLAVIDIGTNSFHMIVVSYDENAEFEIIDRQREVIRLGLNDNGLQGHIHDDAIQRAVSALNRFKRVAESYDAPVRAAATSAVREALNRDDFVRRILNETGIHIEVISGEEEARLIYLGAMKNTSGKNKSEVNKSEVNKSEVNSSEQNTRLYGQRSLCIDIGGGSTEFIIGEKGNILFSESIKLGAVRLSKEFFPGYLLTEKAIGQCRSHIVSVLRPAAERITGIGFEACIGASGTIMSAAMISFARTNDGPFDISQLNDFRLTANDIRSVSREVLSRPAISERKSIAGLEEKRADIIPSGLMILEEIVNMLGINEITLSSYGLREGIVLDTLEKIFG